MEDYSKIIFNKENVMLTNLIMKLDEEQLIFNNYGIKLRNLYKDELSDICLYILSNLNDIYASTMDNPYLPDFMKNEFIENLLKIYNYNEMANNTICEIDYDILTKIFRKIVVIDTEDVEKLKIDFLKNSLDIFEEEDFNDLEDDFDIILEKLVFFINFLNYDITIRINLFEVYKLPYILHNYRELTAWVNQLCFSTERNQNDLLKKINENKNLINNLIEDKEKLQRFVFIIDYLYSVKHSPRLLNLNIITILEFMLIKKPDTNRFNVEDSITKQFINKILVCLNYDNEIEEPIKLLTKELKYIYSYRSNLLHGNFSIFKSEIKKFIDFPFFKNYFIKWTQLMNEDLKEEYRYEFNNSHGFIERILNYRLRYILKSIFNIWASNPQLLDIFKENT